MYAVNVWTLRRLFKITVFLGRTARRLSNLDYRLLELIERWRVRQDIAMEDIAPLA